MPENSQRMEERRVPGEIETASNSITDRVEIICSRIVRKCFSTIRCFPRTWKISWIPMDFIPLKICQRRNMSKPPISFLRPIRTDKGKGKTVEEKIPECSI